MATKGTATARRFKNRIEKEKVMQRENGRDYSDALKKHKVHLILQETEGLNSFQIIKPTTGRQIPPTTAATNVIFQPHTSQAGYYAIIKCRTALHFKVPYKG